MELVADVIRVPVAADGQAEFGRFDYADAFEVRLAEPDSRPAEDWLRAGLEGLPGAVRRFIVLVHRYVLRLRIQPGPGDGLGWRVTKRDPDDMQLEAGGPLIDGLLIARRVDTRTVRLDTKVRYNSRPWASIVWTVIGPLHRGVALHLLRRAASKRSDWDGHPVTGQGYE